MKNIKKYIAWGIISMISISGIVYAAQNIERFDQTVSMNDVITAAWYNLVNGTLDGPNTDGWICSWTASGGIMCNDIEGWSALPSNVEVFNVPFAELIKFHSNCSASSNLTYCISAANRYCKDACVKNPSWMNCDGGVSGKNFTTWFISEINATSAAVSCVWGTIIGGGTVIQKSIYKQSIDNNPDTSVPEWNAMIDLAIEHVPVLARGWGTWWAESCYITQNTLYTKPDWTQVPNKSLDWVYLPWARWETVIQRCADIICSAAYQHPDSLAQGAHCWNTADGWRVWCPNWNYTIKCMY